MRQSLGVSFDAWQTLQLWGFFFARLYQKKPQT
jgi:hypothetical protein